ncbi:MAG TPA: hypothetical protein PL001_10570 [Candidatus Kryptobacter bacterium]|nr:hypothetical protein [Candidatus Kryptobacter bacterium]
MGQQQVLLILLGVLVVAIAIAVGLSLFQSKSADASRDQLINSLQSLASKAQIYYRRPASMGGGEGSFKNFALAPADSGNDGGSFSCAHNEPRGTDYVPGSADRFPPGSPTMYIVGCGKEFGRNGTDMTKAYVKVTKDSAIVSVLN